MYPAITSGPGPVLNDRCNPAKFTTARPYWTTRRVLDRVLDLAEDEIVRLRTQANPPDLVLAPAVGDIGLLEFYRAADAIAAGR